MADGGMATKDRFGHTTGKAASEQEFIEFFGSRLSERVTESFSPVIPPWLGRTLTLTLIIFAMTLGSFWNKMGLQYCLSLLVR